MPIDSQNLGPCLEWPRTRTKLGYGVITRPGQKSVYVHRQAFADHIGVPLSVLDGWKIRHRCDNPSCFKAAHLIIGTQADNIKDMCDRGRQAKHDAARQQLMSEAQKARFARSPMTQEHIAKLSASHIGHRHPEATKAKMSAARAGRKMTEETKAVLRAAWVVRKQRKAPNADFQ
jgi:hypothetical protein